MANAGIGFGTGLLQGLNKNAVQNEQDQRLRALLQGDILGMAPEAGIQPGAIQGLGGGESGGLSGITSALGITKSAGPNIETLIQLRSQLQAKAKMEAQDLKNFHEATALLKTGAELSPEESAHMLASVNNPLRKLVLQGVLKRQQGINDKKSETEKAFQAATTPEDRQKAAAQYFFLTGKNIGKELLGTEVPEKYGTVNTPAGTTTTFFNKGTGQPTGTEIQGAAKEANVTKQTWEAYAGALYPGKTFDQLSPIEKEKVIEKAKTQPQIIVQQNRENLLGGRSAGKSNLARFNRSSGQIEFGPEGITNSEIQQARKEGQPWTRLQPQEIDSLDAIEAAQAQLDRMGRIAQEVGKAGFVSLEAAKSTGGNIGNAVGAIYDAAVLDATLPFDRMQGGVRGAASPQLATMMKGRFPSFKDRPDVVQTKVELLKYAVQAYKNGIIKRMNGVPDSQIGQELDQTLNKLLSQQGSPTQGGVPQIQILRRRPAQ